MGQEMMALRRSRTESRETTWRVTVVGGGGGGHPRCQPSEHDSQSQSQCTDSGLFLITMTITMIMIRTHSVVRKIVLLICQCTYYQFCKCSWTITIIAAVSSMSIIYITRVSARSTSR